MLSLTVFARLIRLPNLVIVLITQYILQYFILVPALQYYHIFSPTLGKREFFLLVLSTILIAASGYIINDIEDRDIDALNKPQKQLVGKLITVEMSYQLYASVVALGLLISAYLAWFIRDFGQLLLYPLAVAMLWAYSKWWKKQALIGNLVVSFFCAFVAGIVLYAERGSFALFWKEYWFKLHNAGFSTYTEGGAKAVQVFADYMWFGFFSTLFREIVKDLEDVEGDAAQGCRTLPIVAGAKVAKIVAFIAAILFLYKTFLFLEFQYMRNNFMGIYIFILGIIIPILYACMLLLKAKEKHDYSFLSKLAKFIMLSGLIYLIFVF
jgi:4-hydroxybenzoate polyprenyltransferase